jgi:hypothetical protein
LFVLGACGNALAMLCYVRTDSLYPYVISIIIVFIGLFVILSVVVLATGGRAIANEVARLEEEARLQRLGLTTRPDWSGGHRPLPLRTKARAERRFAASSWAPRRESVDSH